MSFLPALSDKGLLPTPSALPSTQSLLPGSLEAAAASSPSLGKLQDPTQRPREKPTPSLREGSGETRPTREPSPAWLHRAHTAGTRRAGPGWADLLPLGIRRKHGCLPSCGLSQ